MKMYIVLNQWLISHLFQPAPYPTPPTATESTYLGIGQVQPQYNNVESMALLMGGIH